jgi:hypothetical protein
MSEELTPKEPDFAPAAAPLPDVENLADSDDPEVLEARAKLLEAQAKLTKASVPLLDKLILRGIIPIALAIVGPWALWKFDKAQTEQVRQGAVIVELQELLEDAKSEAAARQARSALWRTRMGEIEEEKATELAAMSAMVCRLDDMLKLSLVQTAVNTTVGDTSTPSSRGDVIRDVQTQLPSLKEDEVQRLAGQQYDRIMEQRTRK